MSTSPLDDRMSSNEDPSGGDSPAGEDDHKWSGGSASKAVSEDGSDWDSD